MQDKGVPVFRFAYQSRARDDIDRDQIRSIAQESWHYNLTNRVFGLLEFRNGRFSQVIEARLPVINEIVPMILADARHHMIDISAFESIKAPTFSTWSFTGFDDLDLEAHAGRIDPAEHSNVIFVDRFKERANVTAAVTRKTDRWDKPNSEN